MPNFTGCSPSHLLLSAAAVLAISAGGCSRAPSASAPGERHLRNVRQLTFGGNNAEAYFSPDGRQLIVERQGPHHLWLLLSGRAPHSLQLHFRELARVPPSGGSVAGLRLAPAQFRDLHRAGRRKLHTA